MDDRRRALLELRTVEVTYRSALNHAPRQGGDAQEWLGLARQRAERYVNALESRLLQRGALDPEIAMSFRVVRETIRDADARARGLGQEGERPADRVG